jgi:hypothetical protein
VEVLPSPNFHRYELELLLERFVKFTMPLHVLTTSDVKSAFGKVVGRKTIFLMVALPLVTTIPVSVFD